MKSQIVWEKPSVRINHAVVASQLRLRPGVWARIDRPYSDKSAKNMAARIKTGDLAMYRPGGAFDAKVRKVRDSSFLFVRYVGMGGFDD